MSIFSDLNNLTDITMDARYATLFGYTREETLANFPEHIAALAEAQNLTPEGAFAKYASDPRKLFKIGCAFDWDARNLGKWLIG